MTDSATEPSILRTFLWFNGRLGEALDFYESTFPDVVIHSREFTSEGVLFTSDFSIYGHDFIGLNWPGGPEFNEAISLSISCDGQEETDRLWDALTKNGKPGNCGWCTDPFGVTWQVTPRQLRDHLGNPDPEKAAYAMAALRDMGKIVIADLYE
jgi:predicted 3-demethylubiquinone-9 3-methyltransferase (glyoxalase superfamily)